MGAARLMRRARRRAEERSAAQHCMVVTAVDYEAGTVTVESRAGRSAGEVSTITLSSPESEGEFYVGQPWRSLDDGKTWERV